MKTLLATCSLLLLINLLPLAVSAQTDAVVTDSVSELSFVAYWSVGDSFRYAVTEINVSYKGDSATVNDTVRYEADFVVVDSTADSYTVVWDAHKAEDESYREFMEQADPELRRALDSLGDLRPRFRTNEFGVYLGIANADELLVSLKLLAPAMTEFIISQDTTYGELIDERQRKILAKYATKKMVKEHTPAKMQGDFLAAVPYLLFPLGAVYRFHDTTETTISLPSNIPDRNVLHHVSYYFDDHYPEDGYVHLKVLSEIDEADGSLLAGETLRLKGYSEDQVGDFVQNGYFNQREDNDFYYYYGFGVAEEVDCYREIVSKSRDEERFVNVRHVIISMIFEEAE